MQAESPTSTSTGGRLLLGPGPSMVHPRVYQAMAARGYNGQVHSLAHPQMGRQDYLTLFGCVVLFVSLVLLSRLLA